MNRSASFAGPDDLSHAWPDASLCNAEQPKEQEIAYLCGIRYPQQCSDTPDRTLVTSSKAVRVRSSTLFLPANPAETRSPDVRIWGFVSSTSAVDYPNASSLALACYTCVRGPAGGVGESYSVDC